MYQLLKALCVPAGVCGDELSALPLVNDILAELGEVTVSPLGSVFCTIKGEEGAPHIMLTAHLDSIGLMVTRITEKGFIKVAPAGGVDRRCLSGARVSVHTSTGAVKGVICSVPPHLSTGASKCLTVDECAIDIGLNYESANKLVSWGDMITFDCDFTKMIGDRVSAFALDDRAGCAAVIAAARELKGATNANITLVLAAQEERGSAGAKTSAYVLSPDYAIAVDVSFAPTPDANKYQCGKMQGGPLIAFAPILNTALSKSLVAVAKKYDIPHQPDVIGGSTGTDADCIASSKGGVKTALLGIPLRFMHTPCEVVSIADIENTAKLIVMQIKEGMPC